MISNSPREIMSETEMLMECLWTQIRQKKHTIIITSYKQTNQKSSLSLLLFVDSDDDEKKN